MAKKVTKSLDEVIFALEVILREAKACPDPVLRVNANALVVEFNDLRTNAKIFQQIARLEEIK